MALDIKVIQEVTSRVPELLIPPVGDVILNVDLGDVDVHVQLYHFPGGLRTASLHYKWRKMPAWHAGCHIHHSERCNLLMSPTCSFSPESGFSKPR